tara:strand:+ start:14031 stop:14615 length:585 start_codon:yes stop_codon:yes gene_type:complete
MRVIVICTLALMLAGCGLKANTFNMDGRGYYQDREAHSRSVCQLDSAMPVGVDYKDVAVVRGNRGFFGGFLPVRQVMADEARQAGIDVIHSMRMRQDVAFRGIFILRPVGEGVGARLDSPDTFNCLVQGGRLYPANRGVPIQGGPRAVAPVAAPAVQPASYDDCMARVLRISDPALRVQAMSVCDGAASRGGAN